jgi:hypothetical protein
MALENHPYAGIDFRGDPNMSLPPFSTYRDIGMPKFLEYFIFFVFLHKKTIFFWMMSSTN